VKKLLVLLVAAAGATAVMRKRKSAEPDLWKQATQAADLR